jgi:hypothetical protein
MKNLTIKLTTPKIMSVAYYIRQKGDKNHKENLDILQKKIKKEIENKYKKEYLAELESIKNTIKPKKSGRPRKNTFL